MDAHPDRDGGWAWVILIVASCNVLFGSGLAIVAGIFQALFLEVFHESIAYTAWVTALFSSLLQLAGPVSSLVSNYFSCRVSVMLGGILLSSGLLLSSFATSIDLLMLTLGVVAGLGLGLTYTPSIVITNYYFHTKRNIMTGAVMSAAGIGILVGPLLSRYLIDLYTWREALVILAAASAHLCICGALMFPIHEKPKYLPCSNNRRRTETNHDKNTTRSDSDQQVVLLHTKQLNGETGAKSNSSLNTTAGVNYNGSIVFGSQLKLSECKSSDTHHNSGSESKFSCMTLLCNKPFLIVCISLFLNNALTGGVFIHYPYLCESQGANPKDVAIAMSVNGPILTFSRFAVGALGNTDNIDYLAVYISLKACGAIFVCFIPLFKYSLSNSIMTMSIMALVLGGPDALTVGITIDCVGLDLFASAVGIQMVCAGLGYLVAPPFVGWIVDKTASYSFTMYISGSIGIASAVICLMIPLVKRQQAPPIGFKPRHKRDTTMDCE